MRRTWSENLSEPEHWRFSIVVVYPHHHCLVFGDLVYLEVLTTEGATSILLNFWFALCCVVGDGVVCSALKHEQRNDMPLVLFVGCWLLVGFYLFGCFVV